jgi:thymidylate synthase (FAD)
MKNIADAAQELESTYGVKREDAAMLLPLGMESTIVIRTNLRNLIDMSHQRLCARAYWEFRKLFKEIMEALAFYSDEWKYIVEELKLFRPKCKVLGYCPERYSCGAYPIKGEAQRDEFLNDMARMVESITSMKDWVDAKTLGKAASEE